MKTRKIAAVVLCVLSVVAIICFRLISAPLTGAVTAAELGSALGALSLLPTVLSVALAFLLGDVVSCRCLLDYLSESLCFCL